MDTILNLVENGQDVAVWNGHYHEMPKKLVSGPCSLKVRVRKRNRLIKGTLSIWGDGYDDQGDLYVAYFTPKRPRVFNVRVVALVMEK